MNKFSEKFLNNLTKLKDFIDKNGRENLTYKKAPRDIYTFYKHSQDKFNKNKLPQEVISAFNKSGLDFTKNANNKVGRKIGKLTFIEKTTDGYKIKCDCGNEFQSTYKNIQKKLHKECNKCSGFAKYDYDFKIGSRIGTTTILDILEDVPSSTEKQEYLGECDCGNKFKFYKYQIYLRNNSKKEITPLNCGCESKIKKEKQFNDARAKSYTKKDIFIVQAQQKKRSSNKSGYIGVFRAKECVRKNGNIVKAQIISKIQIENKNVYIGKYEDCEDSYLQGALDRDIYIIEHKLPHRRNFTDNELLEKLTINERKKMEIFLSK